MSLVFKIPKTTPNNFPGPRVPIEIHPEVRTRLRNLLMREGMEGVGYSAFINRACEMAETELEEIRQKNERLR